MPPKAPASKSKAPASKDKPASKAASVKPASKAAPEKPKETPAPAPAAEDKDDKSKTKRRAGAGAKDEKLTFLDMIEQAITELKEKNGISRQQLKKYLNDQYKIADDSRSNTNISNAIKRGVESGRLHLPKGSSGRIQLASDKENVKPRKGDDEVTKPAATTKRSAALQKKNEAAARKAAKAPAKAPAKKPVKKATAPAAKAAAKAPAKKAAPAKATAKKATSTPAAPKRKAPTDRSKPPAVGKRTRK